MKQLLNSHIDGKDEDRYAKLRNEKISSISESIANQISGLDVKLDKYYNLIREKDAIIDYLKQDLRES